MIHDIFVYAAEVKQLVAQGVISRKTGFIVGTLLCLSRLNGTR